MTTKKLIEIIDNYLQASYYEVCTEGPESAYNSLISNILQAVALAKFQEEVKEAVK